MLLRPGGELAFAGRVLLPGGRGVLVRDFLHRDAPVHGAHLAAEVAADARFLDDLDHGVAIVASEAPNRLMRPVLAGRPAQLTPDALVVVDAGNEMVVEVEILPFRDVRYGAAAKVLDAPVAAV